MTDELIAQLTAEKLVMRGDKRKFVKTRARNELTDLWVYALAALYRLGPGVMNNLGETRRRCCRSQWKALHRAAEERW
jgi:phage terminase large subunit GpA-like protein